MFKEKNKPANKKVTSQITTSEIVELILKHYPNPTEVEPLFIYNWLKTNGYTCKLIGDDFVWLISE